MILLFNIISSIILLLSYIIFSTSKILCIILIVLEIIMIVIFILLVRRKGDFKNIIIFFLVLQGVLLSNIQLIQNNLFLLILSFCTGVIITILAYQKQILEKTYNILIVVIIILILSFSIFGNILYINKTLDNSKENIVSTKIIEKGIITAKYESFSPRSYYISIKLNNKLINIDIKKNLYKSLKKGDLIKIGSKNGFFNIPYYYLISGS